MNALQVPPAAVVNKLVRRWAARHPELTERLDRAAALVANVRPGDLSPNVFFVEGSDGHRYFVCVNRRERKSSCSCPDHLNRAIKCKHILACALLDAAKAA